MPFKDDVSFRRYLTMGAIGTAQVARDLRDRFDHRPIELDRFSMGNKVWTEVKVKRERRPDLVCRNCGRRVESKAKSKLEVKLSHSETAGREWHAGGMRPEDLFAFVWVDIDTSPAEVGRPTYFAADDLRSAAQLARRSPRKSASAGAELDLKWPAWAPSADGMLVGVDDEGRVEYQKTSGRKGTYQHSRKWPHHHLYLATGEHYIGKETIVIGVVPPPGTLKCPGSVWDIAADLRSSDETSRYAAIKAVGITGDEALASILTGIAQDQAEDWKVRLEARGSLARIDRERWLAPLADIAADVSRSATEQMEAVFILSELPYPAATDALAAVAAAQVGREEEVRCGAIWALGTGTSPDPERVLPYLADPSDRVAMHAAAALPDELTQPVVETLDKAVRSGDARSSPLAAAMLARRGHADRLLGIASCDGLGRLWALEALGDLPQEAVETAAGGALDERLRAALEPMWVRQIDWLRTAENERGLEVLTKQRVRYDPAQP